MPTQKYNKGFTLIELLLYMTLAALFLLATTYFFFALLESRTKNSVILNVDGQGTQAMHVITQQVRLADSISSPGTGASGSSLTVTDGGVSYVFSVSGGVLQLTEGANPPVALTNDQVTVTGFTATNYSRSGTPGTVRVEYNIAGSSSNTSYEFTYDKDFTGSASLRRN
jgi:prepilin-type N-terminal cleavage/methylation domain-containing protein